MIIVDGDIYYRIYFVKTLAIPMLLFKISYPDI